jgi:peptidoglycan/LPS O-acetylase OafA/YrhL
LLGGTLALSIVSIALYATGNEAAASLGMSPLWLQLIVPIPYLRLIVSLTRDGGTSGTSALLRSRVAQWLGNISMTVYLLHWPLMYYLCWIRVGLPTLPWPNTPDCAADDALCTATVDIWVDRLLLPEWGIPVVSVATLALSTLVFYWFEEPLRKALYATEGASQPKGPHTSAGSSSESAAAVSAAMVSGRQVVGDHITSPPAPV